MAITLNGNSNVSLLYSSGGRITGDFTNATLLSRAMFQTSTADSTTGIYALPSGTSTAASWQATNNADPTNASKVLIATNGTTDCQLVSGRNGSGTYLPLSFYTNGSQQMLLDTSGNLTLNSGGGIKFVNGAGSLSTTTNGDGAAFGYTTTGLILQGKGSSYDVCLRNNSAGVAGYVATGATTITTSSDERLKENLEPIVNAISKIEQIRAVTGNYKADPNRNVAFLIAQDVDKVFPQAVEKADNNSWGINYNWVIPLLAAAIQELTTRLEALEAQ